MKIITLTLDYLRNWPQVHEYCTERPSVQAFIGLVHYECVGIALHEPGRIHHIFIPEEFRNGGYGTHILNHIVGFHETGALRAVVSPDNKEGIRLFLSNDFKIVGFNRGWDDNQYIMEYKSPLLENSKSPNEELYTSLEHITRCVLPTEVLPERLVQANSPKPKRK